LFLSQVGDPKLTTLWSQEWKSLPQLVLEDGDDIQWGNYTRSLKLAHVRLLDKKDELIWASDPFGI